MNTLDCSTKFDCLLHVLGYSSRYVRMSCSYVYLHAEYKAGFYTVQKGSYVFGLALANLHLFDQKYYKTNFLSSMCFKM